MPDVIVDTSVLQYLHQLGLLQLLARLYGRVIVSPAVAEEVRRGRELGIDLPDLAEVDPENRTRGVHLRLAGGTRGAHGNSENGYLGGSRNHRNCTFGAELRGCASSIRRRWWPPLCFEADEAI